MVLYDIIELSMPHMMVKKIYLSHFKTRIFDRKKHREFLVEFP